MIKSLYVRVIMIFIGAVLLSLIMAFFVSSLLYSNRVENLAIEDLILHGKSIIQTYEQTSPDNFELFIDGVSTISTYRIRVYNEEDQVFDSGRSDNEQHIEQGDISRVLKGGVFRGEGYKRGKDFNDRLIIGMPLRIDGTPHAMFLSPEHMPIMDEFRNFLFTVL
ncbi:MAG: hypothetical protein WDZ91_06510 [Paenibacillaceae bacterium]